MAPLLAFHKQLLHKHVPACVFGSPFAVVSQNSGALLGLADITDRITAADAGVALPEGLDERTGVTHHPLDKVLNVGQVLLLFSGTPGGVSVSTVHCVVIGSEKRGINMMKITTMGGKNYLLLFMANIL